MKESLLKSPRTPHLVGSGISDSGSQRERVDWRDLCGSHVVLEEKVDGSEVSFHFDGDARLRCRERSSEVDLDRRGGQGAHLDHLKEWLLQNEDDLFDRIGDRYVVYAEWCAVAHCLYYDRLPSYLVECDVQDKGTGAFLSTGRRLELLAGLPLAHAPVLYAGPALPERHPSTFVGRSSFCSETPELPRGAVAVGYDTSGRMEGVYGKVETGDEVVGRFKWIREDFVRRIVGGGIHWKASVPAFNRVEAV